MLPSSLGNSRTHQRLKKKTLIFFLKIIFLFIHLCVEEGCEHHDTRRGQRTTCPLSHFSALKFFLNLRVDPYPLELTLLYNFLPLGVDRTY